VTYTRAERAAVLVLLLVMALASAPFAIDAGEVNRLLLYGAFVLYLIVLGLPFVLSRFQPAIFHPLVFYVVWFGIQGLLRGKAALPITGLEYHRGLIELGPTDLNGVVALSFFLDAVALLSLYAGYVSGPRFRTPSFELPNTRWLALKSLCWVGMASLGLLALATIGGGLDEVLMQRGIASDQRIATQVGGHWSYLAGVGVVVPIAWLACDRKAVRSALYWAVVIVAIAIKFAATGSRGGTIQPLIMIGAVYVLQHQRIPYRALLVGTVLSVVMVGGLGEYRSATAQANAFHEVQVDTGGLEWLELGVEEAQTVASANSGELAVLGSVPDPVPYLYGESYLSIPFVFIPSALWGEKPDAAGKLNATRIYGDPLISIPPGPVGEAYWNFSYVGVVVVFVLYGTVLKFFGELYRGNAGHPAVLVGLIYVLFYMQPHSGSIYGFFHGIVPAVLVYTTFVARIDRRILLQSSTRL